MSLPLMRPAALALWLPTVVWQPLAHADVWGYVDEKGVPHFAAERLDERYEFYFSEPGGRDEHGAARPGPGSTAPARLLAFFEVSPDYKQVKHLLREAAREHRIDYELLQALIATESGFDARAVSPRGAVGLMQLMPGTAGRYGVVGDRKHPVTRKLADPRTNIRAGSRHLRFLMARFPGRLDLTLAAYNAGLTAVRRAGNQVPPYPETQNYVRTVLQLYTLLKPPSTKAGMRPLAPNVRAAVAHLDEGVRPVAVPTYLSH